MCNVIPMTQTAATINAQLADEAREDAPGLIRRHRIGSGLQAMGLMQAGVITQAQFRAVRDLLR